MKKLDIETGGHLASNDDLMHLEAKTTNLVEVIFKAMLRNPQVAYKLYGCEVSEDTTEGTLKVSEGAIFYQREFYLVAAQSIPLQVGTPFGFKIIDNPDSPGTKVIYASGAEVIPHQDQVMSLTYGDFDLASDTLEQFNFKHLTPSHQWQGTQLSFELPDGSFGTSVDLRGERGPQGIPGISGQRGERGEQGIKGDQGIPGQRGERGFKGDKGDKGDRGDQGQRGIQGLQGIQGPFGPMPDHEWRGQVIRFQKPNGSWGEWVYLGAGPDTSLP